MAVTVTPTGLPVAVWEPAVAHAPAVAVQDLSPAGTRLVVVGAHPDDETIGAGRLVAEWARTVGPVLALTLTAGEACLDEVGVVEPGLAARRLREWADAVRLLGATPGSCAGLPDGALAAHVDEAAAVLAATTGPGDALLVPWRHDPHPDHVAAGRAAALAARRRGSVLLEYPVWATYWMRPDEVAQAGGTCTVVRTGPAADSRRRAALAAYRSQREPLAPGLGPVVPALLLEHHHVQLLVR